jgi:hypothetical protein
MPPPNFAYDNNLIQLYIYEFIELYLSVQEGEKLLNLLLTIYPTHLSTIYKWIIWTRPLLKCNMLHVIHCTNSLLGLYHIIFLLSRSLILAIIN